MAAFLHEMQVEKVKKGEIKQNKIGFSCEEVAELYCDYGDSYLYEGISNYTEIDDNYFFQMNAKKYYFTAQKILDSCGLHSPFIQSKINFGIAEFHAQTNDNFKGNVLKNGW
jgi:hypothetical protein